MNFLEVVQVSKAGRESVAVNDVSFTQNRFQKIAIAGETGSGKSTLLKLIAGLQQPDGGSIFFEGKRIEGPLEKLLPGHSQIAYLSQHFELRNNYRVEEELDYLNQLSKEEADTLFEVCRISQLLKRKTTEVSGGEKQRISLARLLLSSPKLLLLDEPYSNLDIIHKNILKKVVYDVGGKLHITCLLISHDPGDLLSWADDILVMKEGAIVQRGTPRQIYHQPETEYVAALLGSYNCLSPSAYNAFSSTDSEIGDKSVFIRPERFVINSLQMKFLKGTAEEVLFLGSACEVEVRLPAGELIVVRTPLMTISKGDAVRVSLLPGEVHSID